VELNCRRLVAGCLRARVVVTILLLVAGIGVLLRLDAASTRPQAKKSVTAKGAARPATLPNLRQVQLAYNHSPLLFEPNVGQTNPAVRFIARGSDYALFLTEKEAVLALPAKSAAGPSKSKSALAMASLHLSLAGANPSIELSGSDQRDSTSNYFIGNNPRNWHTGVPHYARVRYKAVYPGIDLIYYGRQGQLEYDFEVAPGADPRQVVLEFDGTDQITLNPEGDLLLAAGGGEVKLHAPRVYQIYGDQQRMVESKFVFRDKEPGNREKSREKNGEKRDQISFQIGNYDRTRQLVIDPVLSYSTYVGGSGQESCSAITGNTVMPGLPGAPVIPGTPGCPGTAVDLGGNIYIAGSTTSVDFPPQPGVGGSLHGIANIFVSEFNSIGTSILSTYLGGTDAGEVDYTAGITIDSGLNVILAGVTNSSTFPTSGAPFQTSPGTSGTGHVFVSKIAPGGVGQSITALPLSYSTYLHGNGTDLAAGVAVDTLGNIYVSGTTTSTNFPTTPGSLAFTPPGSSEFFFAKLDPSLNGTPGLLYSTYIGGTTVPAGATPVATGGGIAVDSDCNAYVTGGTNYTNLPVLNAYQAAPNPFNGGVDAWIGEFKIPLGATCSSTNSSDYVQNYLTYFGGTGVDIAYGIAVDSAFNAYITGGTNSSDLAIGGVIGVQSAIGCAVAYSNNTCPLPEAFVAKFTPPVTTGTTPGLVTLSYATYLGGPPPPVVDNGLTVGLAIAVNTTSGALVTGLTSSTDFTIFGTGTNVFQPAYGGGAYDAFFAQIDTLTGTCVVNTICPSYSSFLGGSGADIGTGIAIDSQQNVYLAGETTSTNFPTAAPFQSALNGPSDAFETKLGSSVNLPTTITKAPSPNPVGLGNAVTFSYTITNDGDQTSGVVFTDSLAPGATFVSATASPGGTCPSPQNGTTSVTCSIGTMTAAQTATVSIIVTPTTAGPITNGGGVTEPALQSVITQPPVTVYDYAVSVLAPAAQTVPAGVPAVYTVQVTPTGPIPETVTLACGTLPTSVTCNFNNASIANLNNGPTSRTLELATTARVTTTTHLLPPGAGLLATLLPISGLALFGMGASRRRSQRRYWWSGLGLGLFFALVLVQPGCSGTTTTTTTTGTPAGTYTVVINATSGAVVRSTSIQLVVQ
jgi:uncharacterized repeat protein (TIGR01451 family)